ncbi:MAG: hypothetical protein WC974_05140 [Thermoplasmata archaeon]
MLRQRRKSSKEIVKIANERIDILFELAEKEALNHDIGKANRYVELARKLGMRYNVRLGRRYGQRFCRYCHSYFIPGSNCTSRLRKKRVVTHCTVCDNYTRRPYIKH